MDGGLLGIIHPCEIFTTQEKLSLSSMLLFLFCRYKEREGLAPAAYLSRYSGGQATGGTPAELVSSVRDAVQMASGTKHSWKPQAHVDVQERESLSQCCTNKCIMLFPPHSNLCTNTQKAVSQGESIRVTCLFVKFKKQSENHCSWPKLAD